MKIYSIIDGKPVIAADVQQFTCTFPFPHKDLDTRIMEWVSKLVQEGWTPVTDMMVSKRQSEEHEIYDALFMAMFVGREQAKTIPVRFVRHGC